VRPSPHGAAEGFHVDVGDFEGPFDLLLSLIAKHEMDVTEIALSRVTDEFLGYLQQLERTAGRDAQSLDAASRFLIVAATLLDVKAAALLPHGELVDAEDAAALESRDLLFARLLQYRAFKDVAGWFATRLERESRRTARAVPLEERFRRRTPALHWRTSLDDFAVLAVLALTPPEVPAVPVGHLHAPKVSVRRQAVLIVELLRSGAASTFHDLVAGLDGPARPGIVVARFVAILELYRRGAVALQQADPLGDLAVRWIGAEWDPAGLSDLGAEYE
jgi:segregation and condensation protein A